MAIADNIKRLRLKRDWTQEHLADLVGVTRSTVTQWETGWSQPRMGAVEKLAAAFGVSVADMVDDGQRELPRGAILPRKSKAAYAPLLGRVHAGDPQDPDVVDGPMVELPESIAEAHPRAYFLEVEGDCMDRVYPEGCLILVDPDREPQNGSIAAVSIDGADYVMRRLLRTSNTMVLAPESFNPEHEDIVITAASGKTVELAGTVVWYQPSREME
ncbi:LexA family protein [Adlercreutzia equolifaciens]|uniref:LexA family protein n=1 Tax=Adlercreutzia equolifaciens TaxID=446660 RepID=UPI0020510320|nr:XRE family transcriptional regulator [Adlercreutzia equolifaciens]DAZ34242.1 MAG TPA: Repressor protein CI [Caudoviricetes sp.]